MKTFVIAACVIFALDIVAKMWRLYAEQFDYQRINVLIDGLISLAMLWFGIGTLLAS